MKGRERPCEDVEVDLDVVARRRPERRRWTSTPSSTLYVDLLLWSLNPRRRIATEGQSGGRRWAQRLRPRQAQRRPSTSRPRSTSTWTLAHLRQGLNPLIDTS